MQSTQQDNKQLSCHYAQLAAMLAKESPSFVFNFCSQRIAQVESVKKICCIPETCAMLDVEISNLETILSAIKLK